MYFITPLIFALLPRAYAQTYSATYSPSSLPSISEQGQSGTNKCGTVNNQTSSCQNVYLNSVDDFCFYAPPEPGANATIGDTERIEVSWCLKDGYGTRSIPPDTITGAHFVLTPDYVQVTGVGNLTQVNIPAGDTGGELDPHGADGNGNPIGGLVFSSAFTGQLVQLHEWTNFMSDQEFCFRGCKDGTNALALCQHIYDTLGCAWNIPGNYSTGVFERCESDTGEPIGVYGTSTFFQGEPSTPSAHTAPPSSMCTTFSTIGLAALSTSSSSTTTGGSSTSRSTTGFTGTASATSSGQSSSVAPLRATSWMVGVTTVFVGVITGALVTFV